ncbi:MAG: VCBS repeat-containing protein [Planctomycetes bacterium]|nr:VCBS repeat-containing protein [Planctomycetota bacterium]
MLVVPVLAAVAASAPCMPDFLAGPVFPVGGNQGVNALADVDADGVLDLSIGDIVYLGDGRGGFSAVGIDIIEKDDLVFDIAFRDFDGDGRIDAACCPPIEESVFFVFGEEETAPGDPRFGKPVVYPSIPGVWHLAAGDFLEDGRLDLVAAGRGSGYVSVFINQGGRTFAPTEAGPLLEAGHSIAAGDIDGDGHLDLAEGLHADAAVIFGRGDGTFGQLVRGTLASPGGPVATHRFRLADLDGNGKADLISIGDAFVLVYLGEDLVPGGTFPHLPYRALPIDGVGRFVEAADINGDGRLDLVAQSALKTGKALLQIFHGDRDPADGALAFVAGPTITAGVAGSGAVLAVGDVDADGAPDIVLTTEDTDQGQVFLNDGTCLLRAERGDANADGVLDLGDPIGVLGHVISSGPLACPEAAEVNGDAQLDLADPVYLLLHLFASGSAPQGPSPVACTPAN